MAEVVLLLFRTWLRQLWLWLFVAMAMWLTFSDVCHGSNAAVYDGEVWPSFRSLISASLVVRCGGVVYVNELSWNSFYKFSSV